MNLIFLFLSIFFSTGTSSFTNNEGFNVNNNNGTVLTPDTGSSKKDKMGNGDFIIVNDIMP